MLSFVPQIISRSSSFFILSSRTMSGGVHLVGGGETKMDDPLHAFILLLQHIHYSTFLAGEFLHCIYSWTKQVSLCAHQWWPPSSFQSKRDFKKLSGRRVFGQLCAAAAVVFSEKLVCTRPSLSSPVWLPVKPAPASWHL